MSNHLRILLLLTGVVAFALSILWIKLAKAQTSCTTHPPLGEYHWARGATVYYALDSSLDASPGGQQDQIKSPDKPGYRRSRAMVARLFAYLTPCAESSRAERADRPYICGFSSAW